MLKDSIVFIKKYIKCTHTILAPLKFNSQKLV